MHGRIHRNVYMECRAKHNLLDSISILFSLDDILFCFCVQILSTFTLVQSIIICIWVLVFKSWNEMLVKIFHDEHQSSGPKTSNTLFGPVNVFRFYLELYKNMFKNLIPTSNFKFSFRFWFNTNISFHDLNTRTQMQIIMDCTKVNVDSIWTQKQNRINLLPPWLVYSKKIQV
jgi:hypothetical protein